jgi:Uma2 family endonuclease
MATASKTTERDRWVVLPATWKAYLRREAARGDRATPRYTYTNGRLTIVSPSYSHEEWREDLSDFLKILLAELHIPFKTAGSVTLRQSGPKWKGVEADATFYLSNLDLLRGKTNLVMGVDPAPDFVIEVVVSHPVRDALLVHAAFGVREVWVLKRKGLTILKLGENGRYAVAEASELVPMVTPSELFGWVQHDDFDDRGELLRRFRAWVIETVVPRARGQV